MTDRDVETRQEKTQTDYERLKEKGESSISTVQKKKTIPGEEEEEKITVNKHSNLNTTTPAIVK